MSWSAQSPLLHNRLFSGRPCHKYPRAMGMPMTPGNAPNRRRDGPRTLCAGTQIPDPLSQGVADYILSRPPGEGRPTPV